MEIQDNFFDKRSLLYKSRSQIEGICDEICDIVAQNRRHILLQSVEGVGEEWIQEMDTFRTNLDELKSLVLLETDIDVLKDIKIRIAQYWTWYKNCLSSITDVADLLLEEDTVSDLKSQQPLRTHNDEREQIAFWLQDFKDLIQNMRGFVAYYHASHSAEQGEI